MPVTALVGVSGTNASFDKMYSYIIPREYECQSLAGRRAVVPFGKGGKKRIGIILKTEEISGEISKLKEISFIFDKEPIISDEFMQLLFWLRDTTLCTYYEAFQVLIPPSLGVEYKEHYRLCEISEEIKQILSDKALEFYLSLLSLDDKEREVLISSEKNLTDELVKSGALKICGEIKQRVKSETVTMIRLSEQFSVSAEDIKLTEKQKKIVSVLMENGAASVRELCYLCSVTDRVIKNMLRSGVIETYEYETAASSDARACRDPENIVLTEEQKKAFEGISALCDSKKPACALLFGVTGSGKTSVFAKLIDRVLKGGKNVIVLIPEISLTPQTVSVFESLFGEYVSVIHSSLSLTQRLNEYKRIKSGKSRIVVGTRSAIFAPLDNIGLIVMDEENESTYRSEISPRYSTREVAKKRCVYHNAVLLLASATPSIESRFYADIGRYKLFTIQHRYAGNILPEVEILDMGSEALCGREGIFTAKLANEVSENLKRGEQSILLLNRRGYHTVISCPSCREVVKCPNCSIPLTYHKINGMLICHYCGYKTEMPESCPKCGFIKLKKTGLGTQKLEDELSELFPTARILRMDADTTYSRYAFEKSFKDFENGEYDIMLGTQMIAKGLDFPRVTLVGVLSLDKALFCGDYKSYERTFSLITQVVGRSGRGDKKGRAFIQTYVPSHYVINLAAMQNYEEFYRQEILVRKALMYPPFCDLCVIGFSSPCDKNTSDAADFFKELIAEKTKEKSFNIPLRVLGPARCIYEKINGKFRYHIIIKCRNNADFRRFAENIRSEYFKSGQFKDVRIYIDLNGEIGL